ncbi:DUF3325 domain-containing protein [Coralloluteibacterium stylophorae]|uniref:DUF3325 domain-containing protein n=1 Tax=Coralloluteibacterium stylophorae TaxID=1776034 RepID=A0A8J7VUI3_9GAMM|nr:DUF3325 domain-containing protein [Coralloluteibacterium stylophorae]
MSGIVPLLLALCYAGWCLLALGMERHHRDAFGSAPPRRRRRLLRGGGWLLLTLAFTTGIAARGWEFGPVAWACALMLAGLAWVLLLALAPKAARWLAVAAPLLAAGTALLAA